MRSARSIFAPAIVAWDIIETLAGFPTLIIRARSQLTSPSQMPVGRRFCRVPLRQASAALAMVAAFCTWTWVRCALGHIQERYDYGPGLLGIIPCKSRSRHAKAVIELFGQALLAFGFALGFFGLAFFLGWRRWRTGLDLARLQREGLAAGTGLVITRHPILQDRVSTDHA